MPALPTEITIGELAERRWELRGPLLRSARAHLVAADERRPAPLRASDPAPGRVHPGGATRGPLARRDRDRAQDTARAANADEGRLGRALALLERPAAFPH